MDYRDEFGSTGKIEGNAFVPYASQEEADAATKSPANPEGEQGEPAEKKSTATRK